jgi:hypothetical protein
MRIEQRVKFGEALRRRSDRRAGRAADVVDLVRPKKLDGGEPGDRLLGRDGKRRRAATTQ